MFPEKHPLPHFSNYEGPGSLVELSWKIVSLWYGLRHDEREPLPRLYCTSMINRREYDNSKILQFDFFLSVDFWGTTGNRVSWDHTKDASSVWSWTA